MFRNRKKIDSNSIIHIVNESLLDDVEVDEVEDSTEHSLREYRFAINFIGSESKKYRDAVEQTLVKRFTAILGKSKNSGTVNAYAFRYAEDVHDSKYNVFEITTSANSDDVNSFQELLLHIVEGAYLCSMGFLADVSIQVVSNLADETECLYIKFFNRLAYNIAFNAERFYKSNFSKFDISAFGKFFVPRFSRFGIIKPLDANKTRYLIYDSSGKRIVLFDNAGNIVNYIITEKETGFNCGEYNEYGLLKICLGDKHYDYINMAGERLMYGSKYSLESCHNFKCGYAKVQRILDGRWNYIDKAGNFMFSEWFLTAETFTNGRAVVQDDKYEFNIIDERCNYIWKGKWFNKVLLYSKFRKCVVELSPGGTYNVLDWDGTVLCNDKLFSYCKPVSERYAEVMYGPDRMSNYLDMESGKLVSDVGFSNVMGWPDYGVFAYCENDLEWNFMDMKTNKPLFSEGFNDCSEVGDLQIPKIYVVKRFGVSGYSCIDVHGKIIKSCGKFSEISKLDDDVVCVYSKQKNMVMRLDGTVIRDYEPWTFSEFHNGYSEVQKMERRGKYNIMDKTGKLVSDSWFYRIHPKSEYTENFIYVEENDEGFGNLLSLETGKLLWDAGKYKILNYKESDSHEYVIVRDADLKSNAFDKYGNSIFPEWIEDDIELISPGIFRIGTCMLVDVKGKMVSCI